MHWLASEFSTVAEVEAILKPLYEKLEKYCDSGNVGETVKFYHSQGVMVEKGKKAYYGHKGVRTDTKVSVVMLQKKSPSSPTLEVNEYKAITASEQKLTDSTTAAFIEKRHLQVFLEVSALWCFHFIFHSQHFLIHHQFQLCRSRWVTKLSHKLETRDQSKNVGGTWNNHSKLFEED